MIEELLKKVLSNNEELISLLGVDTNKNLKLYLLKAPDNTVAPYIEYEILSENSSMHAENKELSSTYKIQIDVFTKGSYMKIVEIIKKIMKEKGFLKEFGGSNYEEKSKLFHYVLRFNYEYESEE